MRSRNDQLNIRRFNFSIDSVFNNKITHRGSPIPPPVLHYFLLLDHTYFLILDNSHLLLSGY